jgi:hypothetical protein
MDSPRFVWKRSVLISNVFLISKFERVGSKIKCLYNSKVVKEWVSATYILMKTWNITAKIRVNSLSNDPWFSKEQWFLENSQASPFVLLMNETYIKTCEWSVTGMILTGESHISRRETFPSATLQTRNRSWTDLESNPSLHGEMPATNRTSSNRFLLQKLLRSTRNIYFGLVVCFVFKFQLILLVLSFS